MAEASRDGNRVTALIGSFNGVPTPLKVEHATGYLKAAILNAAVAAPTVDLDEAGRDDNHVRTALGSFNGLPKPLLIQNATGYLRAVIS